MNILRSLLVGYLVNALWQAPLVLALAWLSARVLRRVGVAQEHRVWVAALVLQATLPILSLLPIAFARWIGIALHALATAFATGHTETVAVTTGVMHPHVPAISHGGQLALTCVCLVLVCAPMLRLLRMVVHTFRLQRRARFAHHVGSPRFGISREIGSPIALGITRATVLFPLHWRRTLSSADVAAAMAHELCHVERHDFAKNLFYEFLACPLLLHPAVWMTRRRLAETREMVCDALASRTAGTPRDYAHSLLRLATASMELRSTPTPHYGIGMFDAAILERRIMQLTHKPHALRTGQRIAYALLATVLLTGAATTALAFGATPQSSDTPSNPHAIHMSAAVMAGQLVNRVNPKYPPEAKAAHIQGAVILHAIIGTDGKVTSLKVISGPPELAKAAEDAVSQWAYKPYILNGQPTEVETTITVNYQLAS